MAQGLKGFARQRHVQRRRIAGSGSVGQVDQVSATQRARQKAERLLAASQASQLAATARGLALIEQEARRREALAIERALNLSAAEEAALEALMRDSLAPSTRAWHATAWKDWATWAKRHSVPVMPAHPRALAAHLMFLYQRGLCAASIKSRLSALSLRHNLNGFAINRKEGDVARVMAGISRRSPPSRPKDSLSLENVHAIVSRISGDGIRAARDRALLLFAFWSAMRCGEISALQISDLTWKDWGVEVRIRRSKTDQAGVGQVVALLELPGVSTCPVTALRRWLSLSKIADGYVFRGLRGCVNVTPRDNRLDAYMLRTLIKEGCEKIGLDPKRFGAHSTRSGFATSAIQHGANILSVQCVLRHVEPGTTLKYAQKTERHRTDAARTLGQYAAALDTAEPTSES